MPAATGLVVIKKFTYRDSPDEEWSNKYWLSGDPPSSPSAWQTLFNELVADEVKLYSPQTRVVRGIGYDSNDDHAHAVWTVDWELEDVEVFGSHVPAAGNQFAGDQAAMVEWKTQRKNTRGKWIYLRKYFHDGETSSSDRDKVSDGYHAALQHFADIYGNGQNATGRVVRSQFAAESFQLAEGSPWITTRTLKRRGKRPKVAQ